MPARRFPADEPRSRAIAALDSLFGAGIVPDARVWGAVLAPNVHLRVGNRPVVIGVPKALAELDRLLGVILTFGSDFRCYWAASDDATLLVESDMVVAASPVSIPLAVVIRAGPDGRYVDVRLYFDARFGDGIDDRDGALYVGVE